jgi:uncharacterized repeat protein (TIGR01451 family)
MAALRVSLSAGVLSVLVATYTPVSLACTDGCLFQKFTTLPNTQRVRVAAIGDVNGDGRNDIVAVGDLFGDGYGVFVFLQGADGSMQPPIGYFPGPNDTTFPRASSVAIGDVNGDGRKDVVLTTDHGIRVMLQNSQGQLGAVQDYATPANNKLRLADFNRDGRLDVVSAGGTTVSVFLQNASGTLDAPRNYVLANTGIADLEVGDLNNDGRLDIVVMSTGFFQYRDLAVLLQDAAGGFAAPAYYDLPVTDNASGIGVGDVNGDGRADIVVTDDTAMQIFVFAQNAGGTFDPPVAYNSGELGSRPMAVDVADMNQDGRADVVVLGQYGNIYVHLQNPDGTLAPAKLHGIGIATSNNDPHSLAVGDVDGDGKPDVVVAKDLFIGGVDIHYATRANLRMMFTADQTSGLVGKPVRYTATIVNDGPDVATDVRLTHVVPPGMFTTGLMSNSQGSCDDNRRTCALGAMAVGQTATVVSEAFAYSQPGTYTNTVSITAFNYDGDTSDNTLSATVTIEPSADLQIYGHSVFAPASGQVSYTVTVVNNGATDAQGVVIADTLPAGVTPTSARWAEIWGGTRSGSCDIAGTQVTCQVGTLAVTDVFAAHYPVAVFVDGQVTTSANLLNVAVVSALTGDPDTSNNLSSLLSTAQGVAVNQPPVIAFAGPSSVRLGAAVVLDARDTRDPEGQAVSIVWIFSDGSQAFGAQARHVFPTAGASPVTVRATDNSGAVSTQTFNVDVVDVAPVAILSSPYSFVRKNAENYLDANRSYDVDGGALFYSWDFGDGAASTGPVGRHTYATSGTFNASVTVSDGAASATATARVFVLNTKPVANAGGRYDNAKNQPTNFDGSFSVDGDGDPLTYRWSFGDGTIGSGARPVHTYAHGGVYTVTLIVNDGEVDSAPSTAQVTVTNHAPVANGGGPYSAVKGQPVTVNGSGSSDADNDALTYRWDFGDGTTGGGATPTHVYAKNGRFTLKLTVNDGDVDSAVYQTTVDVRNR